MRTKRLRAYTLIELTIAMLITVLIIGMASGLYMTLSNAFSNFNKRQMKHATLIQLSSIMKRDIFLSRRINATENGFLASGTVAQIRYIFEPEAVIRVSSKRDTFFVQSTRPELGLKGQQLNYSGYEGDNNQYLIDDISFRIVSDKHAYSLRLHKYYSAEELYNNNE